MVEAKQALDPSRAGSGARRMATGLTGTALLVLGSILASLLGLELLTRLVPLVPALERQLFPVMVGWRQSDYDSLFVYDDGFERFLLRPAQDFRHVHDGGEYDYQIDTESCVGLFIRSPCRTGPEASFHFGDSFTFGFGVAVEDTFVSRLDRADPRPHVNFGVPGDNILSEIDLASHVLASLPEAEQPGALYFHVFLGNDIREGWRYLQRRAEVESPDSEPGVLSRLVKSSRLRTLVKTRLKALRYRSTRERPVPEGYTFIPKHFDAIERTDPEALVMLDRVVAEAAARMAKLRARYDGSIIVSLIPPKEVYFLGEATAAYDRKRHALAEALRAEGAVVVDAFDDVDTSEVLRLFYPIDTHLNPSGHEWFAELLRRAAPPGAT